MEFSPPTFNRDQVDQAGRLLISSDHSMNPVREEALAVMNDWRRSHSWPLQVMRNTLENRVRRIDRQAIIARRLKRLTSIEAKLRRPQPKLELSEIQDIGGCRAIVQDVSRVQKIVRLYKSRQASGHEFLWEDDYISNPKRTGYRSHHLIYQYCTDAPHLRCFNGYRVEIQLRSALQHGWATAVETIDAFTNQLGGLKLGRGDDLWNRFFVLTASAFALRERTQAVPRSPSSLNEIRGELRDVERLLDANRLLHGLGMAVHYSLWGWGAKKAAKAVTFLLRFDTTTRVVQITPYMSRDQAETDLLELEKKLNDSPHIHVVLVEVNGLKNLRKAFPNYLGDMHVFLDATDKVLGRTTSY